MKRLQKRQMNQKKIKKQKFIDFTKKNKRRFVYLQWYIPIELPKGMKILHLISNNEKD